MEPIEIDGHYRLERELRHGGHGVVYYGHDIRLGRPVAVKRVLPHMAGAEGNAALLDEARIIARLQHPCITQVFDVRDAGNGGIYIIMEYVDGRDLRSIIRDTGPLAPGCAAYIASHVCDALQYAHTAVNPADGTPMEIVHRDITPANIMLTRTGGVKLIDFGIARNTIREQDLTMTGTLKGTVAYMAPEQVRGERDLDGRTDLFSLGAVLYEMLSGEKLFGGTALSDYQQMQLVETVDVDIPERCRRCGVPEAARKVLERCLARDRNERYPDAVAVQHALEPLVAGRPAVAVERIKALAAGKGGGDSAGDKPEAGPLPDATVVLEKTAAIPSPEAPTVTLVREPVVEPDSPVKDKPKRNNKLLAVLSAVTVVIAGGTAFMFPAPSRPLPAEKKILQPVAVPADTVPAMKPVHVVYEPGDAAMVTADGVTVPDGATLLLPVRDTVLLLKKDGFRDLRFSITAADVNAGTAGPFRMVPKAVVRKKTGAAGRKKVHKEIQYPLQVSVKTGAFAPLPSADVTCTGMNGRKVHKKTGSNGTVALRLPAGGYTLAVGHRGYRPYEKRITVGKGTKPVTVMLYGE